MTDETEPSNYEALRLEAQAWVVWIRSGEATTQDTAEMMRWRAQSTDHARALAEAAQVRRLIARAGREEDAPLRPARVALPPSALRRGGHPMIGRRALIGGALAASAAGAMLVRPPLGLWPSLAELRSDYRTGVGQRRTITLAKGATAELNTRTSVALRSDAQSDGLELIAGEVAVDVAHPARPVTIRTSAGRATAQTGRFGVRLEGANTCVTCFAGQVGIVTTSDLRAELGAGQQLTYASATVGPVVSVDPLQAEAWRRGLLIFSDAPLGHVVDEVNRYRRGRIIVTNAALGHAVINAVFQLNRIDTAVSQIKDVSNAHVTTLPGGIVLLS